MAVLAPAHLRLDLAYSLRRHGTVHDRHHHVHEDTIVVWEIVLHAVANAFERVLPVVGDFEFGAALFDGEFGHLLVHGVVLGE